MATTAATATQTMAGKGVTSRGESRPEQKARNTTIMAQTAAAAAAVMAILMILMIPTTTFMRMTTKKSGWVSIFL